MPPLFRLPLSLSQLDLVAADSRRLGLARLAAAAVVIALVAVTLDVKRAAIWGAAILVCEACMWAVTGPFARSAQARGESVSDGRRLAYMASALGGCASWLMLSLFYWMDPTRGGAFLAQLIWSSLLLNAISFAFRSNLALLMFAVPVSATMIAAPLIAPRFPGAHQALAVYAAISAYRNVKAARALAETQAELERAKAAAEAANAAKSVFLATMSHEIRTPLNGVLGMAQAMAREPLPPRQQARLDVIRQGGEVLSALLNDILDFARIEAGRIELEETAVDVADLARTACAAFAPLAAEKGVALVLDVDPEAEGLWRGDLVRLRQILFNLVSNAVKFTVEGAVAMRLAVDEGGALEIVCADTGPGIAPERLATLFDRFVQGAASTTRRFGGSGLGLAIARELVELMGGAIAVRTELGHGSEFTVRLPLTRAARPEPAALPIDPGAPSAIEDRPLRILAAEDNPVNQLVLKTLLEPLSADIAFVEDGAQAIDAWGAAVEAGQPFDLILMDVQMPVMDGLTATRAIRDAEASGGRRTPIVALTANVMAHQQADYRSAGMDEVVAKPIELAELFTTIAKLVG